MSGEEVRQPVVAGQFYEGTAQGLLRQIEGCYKHRLGPGRLPEVNEGGPREIIGLISPHAGYQYSGAMAARGFFELARDGRPEVAVVMGPNHGYGYGSAVQTAGAWQTPLGDLPIAAEVAQAVADALPFLNTGARAFSGEHSLEVQLPFLQHLYGDAVPFVPIMIERPPSAQQCIERTEAVGRATAAALEGRDGVLIASNDMTHHQPPMLALEQDNLLTERILAMDPEGMIREVYARDLSMCGYAPVAATLVAAELLGAASVEKLGYSTSGDVIPAPTVVGYLSAKIVR